MRFRSLDWDRIGEQNGAEIGVRYRVRQIFFL